MSVTLDKIPKKINVSQHLHYTLRGLISFTPPISKSHFAIGHYVSYCWRDQKKVWERYDDMTKIEKLVRQSTEVKCQFLIYA